MLNEGAPQTQCPHTYGTSFTYKTDGWIARQWEKQRDNTRSRRTRVSFSPIPAQGRNSRFKLRLFPRISKVTTSTQKLTSKTPLKILIPGDSRSSQILKAPAQAGTRGPCWRQVTQSKVFSHHLKLSISGKYGLLISKPWILKELTTWIPSRSYSLKDPEAP